MGSLTAPTVKKIRISKIQDGGRPPFWKKPVKSLYLYNRLTYFDEILYNDAYWTLTSDLSLKFRIFENSRWRRPPSWEITQISTSPQRCDRSLRNLVRWCKVAPLTAPTVKKLNFKNPRWRTAAILKTVKSPYLCNLLTDFDWISHGDACRFLSAWRKVKSSNFRQNENHIPIKDDILAEN